MVQIGGVAGSRGQEAQPVSFESLDVGVNRAGVLAGSSEPSAVASGGNSLGSILAAAYEDQGAIRDEQKQWDEQWAITVNGLVYGIKPGGRVTIRFTPDEGKKKGKKLEVSVERNSDLVGKCESSKDDPNNAKKKVHLNIKGGSLVSFKVLA